MNDMDTASFLEELDAKECALAFRLISKEKAANIFSCMSSKMQTYLVDMFSETELKELLDDLYMDDTVDMLEDLPANLVTRILKNLDSNKRSTINKLLKYPEDSAGSIMTTEYVTLKKTMTVKQAMNHIKDIGIHKETIYTCYVTENKRLMGIVTAKSLMTSDDDENITNLMNTNIISVHTHTDQEQVAHLFRKYDLIAMPVLDSDGCLVGIVTFDDAMDVMVDETNEDISRMAAMEPNEKTYFETTVWQQAKHRILWLLVLMFSATITGSIITRYENAFSAVPLLVSFIPMLMDTGGNCGSQSSTLIIRGLALGEIHFKEINALIGVEQPIQYHPEGDAYNHTMCVLDMAANLTEKYEFNRKLEIRFSALVHDLGKGTTPKAMYPHHYGHEERGVELVRKFSKRIGTGAFR